MDASVKISENKEGHVPIVPSGAGAISMNLLNRRIDEDNMMYVVTLCWQDRDIYYIYAL